MNRYISNDNDVPILSNIVSILCTSFMRSVAWLWFEKFSRNEFMGNVLKFFIFYFFFVKLTTYAYIKLTRSVIINFTERFGIVISSDWYDLDNGGPGLVLGILCLFNSFGVPWLLFCNFVPFYDRS